MMNDEDKVSAAPASEDVVASQEMEQVEAAPESPAEKMVPLTALEAERKKRQEMEYQNRVYQEYLMGLQKQQPQQAEAPEDDGEWITRGNLKQNVQMTKQEILEQVFIDSNPEKVVEINNNIEKLIEKKPWLAQAIQSAPNRYARAYELIQDYKGLLNPSPAPSPQVNNAQRILDNAQKPGSPSVVAKQGQNSKSDYLLSIRGTEDFRKYRREVMGK